jgi:hypothetical protein
VGRAIAQDQIDEILKKGNDAYAGANTLDIQGRKVLSIALRQNQYVTVNGARRQNMSWQLRTFI